jgi:hypothetical protein
MVTVPSQKWRYGPKGKIPRRSQSQFSLAFSDTRRKRMADFEVSCHGTIFIFTPLTPAARDWVAEFLPEDAQRWAGGVAIEHRYISDVVKGARRDGLMVRG